MRLLVYEYLTGGGLWSEPQSKIDQHPLLAEGRCIVEAICEDLSRVAGIELVQLRDARLTGSVKSHGQIIEIDGQGDEAEQLAHWSACADGTLLVAPEHGGRLLKRCEIVQRCSGQLISPDASFVRLTADKHATAEQLAAAGIPTPSAVLLNDLAPTPPDSIDYPSVLKPVDGVGSLDTYLLGSPTEWPERVAQQGNGHSRRWLVEEFCPGTSVSVAAFCGPRGHHLLPPCYQRIAGDGRLTYLGGNYPLAPALVSRACELARRTLAALPPTTGYVGIDMILSRDVTPRRDVVVDVNPRLTTSYVGLRQAASSNLARAMLAIGQGMSCPLFFQAGTVEFTCG